MSSDGCISLIDLSKQLPFEIGDALKKDICFSETLVISCGHYEGEIGEESTESEWSCHESSDTEISEPDKDDKVFEVKDHVEEESVKEDVPEEEDFHFYFFPDCNKPLPPQDSKASLIIVDGLPQKNPASRREIVCTCHIDKKGKCECHVKLPCECGAKKVSECICDTREKICICTEGEPKPVCTCKGSKVCLCYPDNLPRPKCTCHEIDKPCMCHPGKFASPVCICKHKPKFSMTLEEIKSEGEFLDGEFEIGLEQDSDIKNESVVECEGEQEPCDCQKPDIKHCLCLVDEECICNIGHECVCGVQNTCVCQPSEGQEIYCKGQDSKIVCSCPDIKYVCRCAKDTDGVCECFPVEAKCTCNDPKNCKCFIPCDCSEPCICDIATLTPNWEEICTCLDKSKDIECTCPEKNLEESKKLKKIRAGKHGYRWCHDVDPKHTFFDYAYGRHDKISYKEQEKEKLKILGLYDEEEEDVLSMHEVVAPPFKKKIRKASIDCCSAVGGISISVESLGEDKDKFLVQVVSHASKEGAKTGTKLVSIVDCNLHTMEENRTEHITKKDITKERRSYMAICESGYYNKVTRVCGDRHVIKRFHHSFEDAREFLLEGANVVLLRYFGLCRYKGNVKTDTVLIDGVICESIYACQGVSQAIVNGKPLFVVKVERHIIEPSGFMHQTLTVMSLRGYVISHEWADQSYIFHLNPLLEVIPEKDEIEQHAPLREKWRDDLQLLSDYLDFKSTRTSEGGRYVVENGALTGTVRDYLQALLLLRPRDALHFTRHYFGSALSSLDLPHVDYFDPGVKRVRYFYFEE